MKNFARASATGYSGWGLGSCCQLFLQLDGEPSCVNSDAQGWAPKVLGAALRIRWAEKFGGSARICVAIPLA
jgi:hypothetical protein